MSSWTTREEAAEAERLAWKEYGWTKLEAKRDGTVTWIETHRVQCKPNKRNPTE